LDGSVSLALPKLGHLLFCGAVVRKWPGAGATPVSRGGRFRGSTRRREGRGRTVDGRQVSSASAIEVSSATTGPEARRLVLTHQTYGAASFDTLSTAGEGMTAWFSFRKLNVQSSAWS
jgi:hypothetical protein